MNAIPKIGMFIKFDFDRNVGVVTDIATKKYKGKKFISGFKILTSDFKIIKASPLSLGILEEPSKNKVLDLLEDREIKKEKGVRDLQRKLRDIQGELESYKKNKEKFIEKFIRNKEEK